MYFCIIASQLCGIVACLQRAHVILQIGAVYGKENRALTNLIANIIIEAQHLAGNGRHNGNLLRGAALPV